MLAVVWFVFIFLNMEDDRLHAIHTLSDCMSVNFGVVVTVRDKIKFGMGK